MSAVERPGRFSLGKRDYSLFFLRDDTPACRYYRHNKTAERLEEKSGGLLLAVAVSFNEGFEEREDFFLLSSW